MAAGGTMTPETARQLAETVLSREHFELGKEAGKSAIATWLADLLEPVGRFIAKIFRWLIEFGTHVHEASPFLYWLLVGGLTLLLIALVAHIALTFRQALRERQRIGALSWAEAAEEGPDLLEKRARAAADTGDYFLSLSLLFKAGVLRLEMRDDRPFQPSYTNREYLRRYEKEPVHAPLAKLVGLLEKWYAGEPIGKSEHSEGTAAYTSLRKLAKSSNREHQAQAHQAQTLPAG